MLELKDWIKLKHFPDKPWLVLGKGPTFAKRSEIDLDRYNTFALNHVVREQRVDIAHLIDIDVVEPCGESLINNCTWLIMPRRPHVNSSASDYMDLADWVNCIPVLAEAEKCGKLVTYSFAHEPITADPWTIDARYFSSEVALGLLGRMGIKTIRSLGIDGGNNYSSTFADLSQNTLLANGQSDFDLQFDRLREIANNFNIDYSPLIKATQEELHSPSTKSIIKTPLPVSTVTKIQNLECDLRALRREFDQNNELLAEVTKELSIFSQRLAWADNEISEYKTRVRQLEQIVHELYRSKTWKIGRVVTKPAEALSRCLNRK